MESPRASELLSIDEDSVWALLGATTDHHQRAGRKSRELLIEDGKKWFKENYNTIRNIICGSAGTDGLGEVAVAITLCRLLSPEMDSLVAELIAVLIARRSVSGFCSEGDLFKV